MNSIRVFPLTRIQLARHALPRIVVSLLLPSSHYSEKSSAPSSSSSSSLSTSRLLVTDIASSVRENRVRSSSLSETKKWQKELLVRMMESNSKNGTNENDELREKISAVVDELLALDNYVGVGDDEGEEVRRTHLRRRGDSRENNRDVVWFYNALKDYKHNVDNSRGSKLIDFDTLKKIAVALSRESFSSEARSLILTEMDMGSSQEAIAASLVIQCFCISENIVEAESLFFAWLFLRHCEGYAEVLELKNDNGGNATLRFILKLLAVRDGTIYRGLAEDLIKEGKVTLSVDQRSVFEKALEGLNYKMLISNDVPTEVWESLLKMYSKLRSSQSCHLISNFYEERYSSPPTPEMCHYTMYSLCTAKMYELAMQYATKVRSIKSGGEDSDCKKDYLSVSVLAYMMGILSNTNEISDEKFMALYPSVVDAIIVNNEAHIKVLQGENGNINEDSQQNHNVIINSGTVINEYKLDLSYQGSSENEVSNMVVMLSNALCLRGQLDKAARLLPELHKAGVMITADAVEPVINGYARFGEADEALKLFEWMLTDVKTSPLPMSYHSVCESMRKAGSMDTLAAFMTKYGNIEKNYDE